MRPQGTTRLSSGEDSIKKTRKKYNEILWAGFLFPRTGQSGTRECTG
jgi:hypothetical protein